MLDSHPNVSCGPETGFLHRLARSAGAMAKAAQRFGFAADHWDRRIASEFDSFHLEYARRRGRRRWADKTPNYALAIDYLDRLFPTCQVVHIIRDGRDVVGSHRARWGYWSALKAVVKWPRYIQTARRAGRRLPGGRYREVRYEDLVRLPEATMRDLLEWLGEPWDPRVLDPRSTEHDVGPLYDALTAARRGDGAETIYRSRVGASAGELDPLLTLAVRIRSGRLLRRLGYR